MTDEEKIFEISKRIGYKVGTYCNDEEVEVFEKLLKDYKYKNNLVEKQQKEIENAYWKGYTARDTEAQNICKSCKYRKT